MTPSSFGLQISVDASPTSPLIAHLYSWAGSNIFTNRLCVIHNRRIYDYNTHALGLRQGLRKFGELFTHPTTHVYIGRKAPFLIWPTLIKSIIPLSEELSIVVLPNAKQNSSVNCVKFKRATFYMPPLFGNQSILSFHKAGLVPPRVARRIQDILSTTPVGEDQRALEFGKNAETLAKLVLQLLLQRIHLLLHTADLVSPVVNLNCCQHPDHPLPKGPFVHFLCHR